VVLRLRPTRSRGRLLALTLGTLTVGGLISVLTGSSVSGRYTSVAFLPFLLLAAFGVAAVPGRRARVLVLTVVVGLGLGVGAPAVLAPRTQAPQVAHALSAAAPGDVVVFCPDQLGPAVSRLAPPGLELVGYPDLRPADRVDWTDYARRNTAVPSATVAERVLERATGAGIWVVTSDDYRVPSTERCHDLVQALAAVRGSPLSVVARRPHVFENERLQYFARDGQAEPAQLPGRPR
jgi:mannosyltransferase